MVKHMYVSELEISPTEISVATSEKVIAVANFEKKPKLKVVVKGKLSFICNILWILLFKRITFMYDLYIQN